MLYVLHNLSKLMNNEELQRQKIPKKTRTTQTKPPNIKIKTETETIKIEKLRQTKAE